MTVHKTRQEETRSKFIQGAFLGWQIQEQLKGLFGGEKTKEQPFEAYLKSMGLSDEKTNPKTTKHEREKRKTEALSKADKIIQLDQKRRVKSNG